MTRFNGWLLLWIVFSRGNEYIMPRRRGEGGRKRQRLRRERMKGGEEMKELR
jgi:hypothetical protein